MIDCIGRTFAPQKNASPTCNLSQAAPSGRPTAVRRCPFFYIITGLLLVHPLGRRSLCRADRCRLSPSSLFRHSFCRVVLNSKSWWHFCSQSPMACPSDAGVWHQPISLQPEASCAVRAAGSSAWPPITPSAVAVCVAALELMLLQVAGCDSTAC